MQYVYLLSLAAILLLAGVSIANPEPYPGEKSTYHSFDRYDFVHNDRECIIVCPKNALPGKPWVWKARFFTHFPQVDLALLDKGFHVVYCDVAELFGSPRAVDIWNNFHAWLTETYDFAPKTVLEGLSRGGLIIYNWAIQNPEKVWCLYGDAPVCDLKSWPGVTRTKMMEAYGFTPATFFQYTGNPVDNLEPLAKANVPILHVVGDADETVPVAENTAIVEKRYRELGGSIQVIHKPGVAHHPHSLEDPTPIVDFILQHVDIAAPPAK